MLKNENSQHKFALTDEQVDLYIHTFFKVSPRRDNGTAPVTEWLQFLELYNEREGHFILNSQEMHTIRPYCEENINVEMTPDEFIRLLHLVRTNKIQPDPPIAKKLLDSRPRSSVLLTKNNSYYDVSDRESINHPNHVDDSVKSVYSNDDDNEYIPHHSYADYGSAELDTLKKNNTILTKQIREYESRMSDMSKENTERISQLQTRLEYMNIEAEKQKTIVSQLKHKERERLDKLAELQGIIDNTESQTINTLKKLQKKQEELELTRSKLSSVQETLQINENKSRQIEGDLFQAKDVIRVLENEKNDLQIQLDQEKRLNSELKIELEEQQNENTKLLEIIDRQKFDLDEARSGLRYHNASPALDKNLLNVNQNASESSLAQEQLIAEYIKKIEALENQNMTYKKQLSEKEDFVHELANTVLEQKLSIQELTTQFSIQHKIINSIEAGILSLPKRKIVGYFTICAWIFLVYHLLLLLSTFISQGKSKAVIYNIPFRFIEDVLEWYKA